MTKVLKWTAAPSHGLQKTHQIRDRQPRAYLDWLMSLTVCAAREKITSIEKQWPYLCSSRNVTSSAVCAFPRKISSSGEWWQVLIIKRKRANRARHAPKKMMCTLNREAWCGKMRRALIGGRLVMLRMSWDCEEWIKWLFCFAAVKKLDFKKSNNSELIQDDMW